MKTTFLNFKLLAMALGAVLVLSCSAEDGEDGVMGPQGEQGIPGPQGPAGQDGEDGAIGPQGPQGEQGIPGEDGEDGEDGADGQNGADGNANVTSILFENQTINTGNNVFDVPQLTQSIFDSGIVYAYATVTGNTYWEVLPLSSGGEILLEIDRIEVGSITLKATFTQSNLRLRFVLVEGNLTGKTGEPDIKNMSYEEAMDYLGLNY